MRKYFFRWFPEELETEFSHYYNEESATIARWSMALGAVVFCAFYIWDRVVDPGNSLATLMIRLGVALMVGMVFLVPQALFVTHLQKITSATMITSGLAHVGILALIKDGFVVGMPGIILVLMYNFVFFRLLFVPSVVGGFIVMTVHELVMGKFFLSTDLLIIDNFFLISTLVSGAAVTYLLEQLFRREFLKSKQLDAERAKSDVLIESLFPSRVAQRLKAGEKTIAESHGEATILFSDLVGFTVLTRRLAPGHLVEVLTDYFSILDALTEKHGVEKIKTVGDAYMVASGLNYEHENSAEHVADFALDMVQAIREYAERHHFPLEMRVGISTGQAVSGVIGLKKPTFDVWGETVNLASRMESHSEPGHIQVSEATYWRLQESFELATRGPIDVKGVGTVETYFLIGRKAGKRIGKAQGTVAISTGDHESVPQEIADLAVTHPEYADLSLLSDEFLAQVRRTARKDLAIEAMKRLIGGHLRTRAARNVTRFRIFWDRLEAVISRHHDDATTIVQTLEELIQLTRDIRTAGEHDRVSGLTDEEAAFYDAIAASKNAPMVVGEPTLRALAHDLATIINDHQYKVDNQVAFSRVDISKDIRRTIESYRLPRDLQETAIQNVIEQANETLKNPTGGAGIG